MAGSITQAHYPEICFAWLMSFDVNYNPDANIKRVPLTSRNIRINCPVDINVYDSNDTLVASIINNIPQDIGSSIVCFINEKDEKVIFLPADEDYNIAIQATDDGEVTYSVGEYDIVENAISRLINYYSIPIMNGDSLLVIVPSFTTSEIENGVPDDRVKKFSVNKLQVIYLR